MSDGKEKARVDGEQTLAERCVRGDPEAWETLVRTYHRRIYNLAYRYTRRFDRAEELTQDAFLKLYQNLGSFRPESGSLQNWVMRVSRNSIIDQYRHTRRDSEIGGSDSLDHSEVPDERQPSAEAFVNERERREMLLDAVHALPPDLRQAVLLRDLEEMTYDAIAALLQIPEGTVKSRINRGRIELARILAARHPYLTPAGRGEP